MNDFLPEPGPVSIRRPETRLEREYELLGTLVRCTRATPVKPTVRVPEDALSEPILRHVLMALRKAWPWDHWLDANSAVWEQLGGDSGGWEHGEIANALMEMSLWSQPPGAWDELAKDYLRLYSESNGG